MRLCIKYGDQNDSLQAQFPVVGEARGPFSALRGEQQWYVLQLSRPFEHEANLYGQLLVASRWIGRTVAEAGTSVFVLGVPDAAGGITDGFDVEAFPKLVWGLTDDV